MLSLSVGRKIKGLSAVLLPYEGGEVSFDRFGELLHQTVIAGLEPAVNMDTGYANFLSLKQRVDVLSVAKSVLGDLPFVAGAHAEGQADALHAYESAIDSIVGIGGIPVLFPSSYMRSLPPTEKVELIQRLARRAGKLIAFELGEVFVPYGEIWSEEVFAEVLAIPEVIGSKHSSLRRDLEWKRLEIRNRIRPDYRLFTGNDLAIDMVMWGSDYLLGLSAFHPPAFAMRDRWWMEQDQRFYELNDALQALGAFAFRTPVPAYKHSCAQLLKIRGLLQSNEPHPKAARRPDSDIDILAALNDRIEETMAR